MKKKTGFRRSLSPPQLRTSLRFMRITRGFIDQTKRNVMDAIFIKLLGQNSELSEKTTVNSITLTQETIKLRAHSPLAWRLIVDKTSSTNFILYLHSLLFLRTKISENSQETCKFTACTSSESNVLNIYRNYNG